MKPLREPNGENRRLRLYNRLPWAMEPPERSDIDVYLYKEQSWSPCMTVALYQVIDGIQVTWKHTYDMFAIFNHVPEAERKQMEIWATKYDNPMSLNMFSAMSPTVSGWVTKEFMAQDWEPIVREEWEKRLTRESLAATVTA